MEPTTTAVQPVYTQQTHDVPTTSWRRPTRTSWRRLICTNFRLKRRLLTTSWKDVLWTWMHDVGLSSYFGWFYVEKTSLRRCMYVVCRRCLNVIFKVEKTSSRRRRFYLGVFKVKDTSLRRCMYGVSRHPLDVLFGLKRRLPDVVYTSFLRHL